MEVSLVQVLYFNGSNGQITLPDGIQSSNMSVSLWLYSNVNAPTDKIVIEFSNGYGLNFNTFASGKIAAQYANSNSSHILSNSTISSGQWYHIVGVFNSSSASLYINGTSQSGGTVTDYLTSDQNTIGSRRTGQFFDGKIDQVRIFQKELSASEVSTLYAETASTVESLDPLSEDTTDTLQVLGDSSCIATYRFENNEDDESGNYDGTGVNVQYAAGRYGQAARFGNSSYVDLGTITRTSSMTLSAWVKTTGNNLPVVFLDNGTVFRLSIDSSGYAKAGNLNGTEAISTTTVNNGSWNHIVAVFNDSGFRRIYVNSSLEDSETYASATRTYKDGIAIDNTNPASSQIDIDQVRIFNKALSASEVTTLYNENSLVASYRFEGNANDDMRAYDGTATNVTYEYGLGFTPDLVWLKQRDAVRGQNWYDSTRGAENVLFSNGSGAASQETAGTTLGSFDTGGFTVGTGNGVNANGGDFVAWCLKANGGTTSSNTDGTITSTVQANTDAGFSIATYTGTGSNATVGHGLGVQPYVVITKGTDSVVGDTNWKVYHNSLGGTKSLKLNGTDAASTSSTQWNDTDATSTVFSLGTSGDMNGSGAAYIAYCFAPVDGFSKFGSYTGNGSSNIIETGFEPAFIMFKRTDAANNWLILDNKRNTLNPRNCLLIPNSNSAEDCTDAAYNVNFLSNGFELLSNGTSINASGGTYIYMAFAADPDTEAPTVAKSFNTITWSGDGTSDRSFDGLGFQPSLIWAKVKSGYTFNHTIYDSVRGPERFISSDSTAAERVQDGSGYLTSFDSDGFSTTGGSPYGNEFFNKSGGTYVAWAWKADDNEATIEKETSDLDAVAIYKFEDNGDDVTGSYDATSLENITYSSSGKFNKAIEFNGSNSAFRTTGTLGLTGNMDFGVSFWMNADSLSGDQFLWGSGVGGANFGQVGLMIRNNTTIYADNRGNTDPMTSSQSLSTGTWYHIVHTYSSSAQTHYLYINGSYIGSVGTVPINITTNNGSTIGIRPVDDTYRFDGRIDQFRVYHATLTSSNVTTLYNETASDNDDLNLGMTYVSSIESIVSANANAGFSIVKYEGTGSNTKVPHGLSAAPEMMIIKNLDEADSWVVYHSAVGTGQFLSLNATDAASGSGDIFGTPNDTGVAPTSTVFTVGSNHKSGANGENYIAYCFHSVSGYSKIGSYTGNGSGSGQTITTGFQPDWIILKCTSVASEWVIVDSVRGDAYLLAESSGAEVGSYTAIDFLSTGFKLTGTSYNESGRTFIYWTHKIN